MISWEIAEVIGQLPNSSNVTLLARATDDTLLVYKPQRGERELHDFGRGTLAAREVLAYETAEACGMPIVPPTALIEGPFGSGSAQRFVEENFEFDPVDMINKGADVLWPLALLDVLINNADRKAGHIISETGSGRLWGIDHGVSFHEEPKLRTVLWAFADRPLPDAMVKATIAIQQRLAEGFHERLSDLLSEREADALQERVSMLIDNPVHPHPPTDRPAMPWPVW